MPWTCPKCHKTFAKENQSHKCEVVALEDLFEGRSAHLPQLFAHFTEALQPIGAFTVTTSRKAITLYAPSHRAFLGIELKKKFLDIWFVLGNKADEFPVFKIVQPSKNRFGHYVRLTSEEDLESLPLGLIQQAYDRVNR